MAHLTPTPNYKTNSSFKPMPTENCLPISCFFCDQFQFHLFVTDVPPPPARRPLTRSYCCYLHNTHQKPINYWLYYLVTFVFTVRGMLFNFHEPIPAFLGHMPVECGAALGDRVHQIAKNSLPARERVGLCVVRAQVIKTKAKQIKKRARRW